MGSNRETKRKAFVRLGEKRTNAVIDRIRILSHCANPYYYEYSEEDIKKVFNAIDEELKIAKGKFMQTKPTKGNFSLK